MDGISIISIALLVASFYMTFKKKRKVSTQMILTQNPPKTTSSDIVHEGMSGDYERNKIEIDKSMTVQEKEMTTDDESFSASFDLKQAMVINEILNRPSF